MIVNQGDLLEAQPLEPMLVEKRKLHGVSHGLSEAGYDIRIKQDVIFEPTRDTHNHPSGIKLILDSVELSGRFTIASAIEKFTMPNDLVGVVHDKSTWARKGLSVFNTVIEPGFRGGLTLELVYHGVEHLHIPSGAGIAQVLFSKIGVPVEYNGKYQDQSSEPVDSIFL